MGTEQEPSMCTTNVVKIVNVFKNGNAIKTVIGFYPTDYLPVSCLAQS